MTWKACFQHFRWGAGWVPPVAPRVTPGGSWPLGYWDNMRLGQNAWRALKPGCPAARSTLELCVFSHARGLCSHACGRRLWRLSAQLLAPPTQQLSWLLPIRSLQQCCPCCCSHNYHYLYLLVSTDTIPSMPGAEAFAASCQRPTAKSASEPPLEGIPAPSWPQPHAADRLNTCITMNA